MASVVIVKTGVTIPSVAARRGDFEDWISAGLGLDPARIRVFRVCEGEALPDPGGLAGAVVTGSAAMVTDREPWSEATAAWLADAVAAKTPLLGICYGHQLLAHGLGGRIAANPRGREIGTVDLVLTAEARDDALLGEFAAPLRLQTSHVESVLALPPGATRLAATALDPNHAFRISYGDGDGRAAWGVQFHPEFDADIVRGYIAARRGILLDEGLDADALLSEVVDAPAGTAVLRRFAQLLDA
jgi:GMP synthase (glutamine-hydrolysing)